MRVRRHVRHRSPFKGRAFVAFIPVEEAQLPRERGDTYREYMWQTPWRIVQGIG